MAANRGQGLLYAQCPDNRCDTSVKYGIYELFLCLSCETVRDEAAGKNSEMGRQTKVLCKSGLGCRSVRQVPANRATSSAAATTVQPVR